MRRLLPSLLATVFISSGVVAAQGPIQAPVATRAVAKRVPQWSIVTVQVPSHVPQLRVRVNPQVGNDADLFLRKDAPPTLAQYDAASRTPGCVAPLHLEAIFREAPTPPLPSAACMR